jgi:hypothetical protein
MVVVFLLSPYKIFSLRPTSKQTISIRKMFKVLQLLLQFFINLQKLSAALTTVTIYILVANVVSTT